MAMLNNQMVYHHRIIVHPHSRAPESTQPASLGSLHRLILQHGHGIHLDWDDLVRNLPVKHDLSSGYLLHSHGDGP